MKIMEVEKIFIDNLIQLDDPSSQCDYLMILGMNWTADGAIRTERHRIGGCKTAIWLNVEQTESRIQFSGDSDSIIVRGVLAIMDKIYNGRSLKEVQANPPHFINAISDQVIYPEIKINGISKCYQRLASLY